jgi:hypothetical protein
MPNALAWERQSLWYSGQSSWLLIQRSGFDSRRYQIFWEVMGLERGPLSLVSTIVELLERKISGCSLENRDYGRRNLSCWPRSTLYPQKLELTLPRGSSRSVVIVRSRCQATGVFFISARKVKSKTVDAYRLVRHRGFQIFLYNRLTDGDDVVSLTRRPPFTPSKIPGTTDPLCGYK